MQKVLGSYGDSETFLTPSLFCVTLSNHPHEEVKITNFHYAAQRHLIFFYGITDAYTTVRSNHYIWGPKKSSRPLYVAVGCTAATL